MGDPWLLFWCSAVAAKPGVAGVVGVLSVAGEAAVVTPAHTQQERQHSYHFPPPWISCIHLEGVIF